MQNEKADIEQRLQKARVTYDRYKKLVEMYPRERERLFPILQGCKDLIWDLEQRLQSAVQSK